ERLVNQHLGRATLPSNKDIETWQENLKQAYSVLGYLERRGITDKNLIHQFELGFDGERLTLPIRDEQGNLLNVRRLRVGDTGDKVLNWPGFGKCEIWPRSLLAQSDTVLLCAGEFDAMSAIQQGYNAVTGTGGETVWRKELTPLFSGKTVYIVYDGDAVGRAEAQNRASDLIATAKEVYIVNLPDNEDVNSLHQPNISLAPFLEEAVLVGIPGTRKVSGIELLREAGEEANRPWLIEGILRPGWMGVLGGHPKSGKTTLVAHMLRSLRRGEPFLGFKTQPVSNLLYVSYEMAIVDLVELFQDVFGDVPEEWPHVLLDPPRPLESNELKTYLELEPGVLVIDSA